MRRILAAAVGLLALTGIAFGQATSVQQSGSRLDAATAVAYATAAQGSAATATITVPAGQFAYITGVSIGVCANTTGGTALTNTNFTSTNIVGLPSWAFSHAGTASTCAARVAESFPTPLKSANAGTAVTVVGPTGVAQLIQDIRVYYYLAP